MPRRLHGPTYRRAHAPTPAPSPNGPTLLQWGLLAGAICLGAGACDASGPTPAGPEFMVRDSAGVRIVENHRPVVADSLPWRVAREPAFSVGTEDGVPEESFHRVEMTFRLPDGTIGVTDRGSHEIRFFHPDGRFFQAIGGRGEGPGEFGTLHWARTHPIHEGRILAYDMRGNTVLHLSAEGREVERLRIEPFRPDLLSPELERDGRLAGAHVLLGVFADGSFLSEAFESILPEWMTTRGGIWDFESLLLHVHADNGVVTPAGRFLRSRHLLDEPSGQLLQLPFGPAGRFLPFGNRTLHTDGTDFELRLFDREGTLLEIWRRDWDAVPVTAEDRRQFRERSLQSAGYVAEEAESEGVTIRRRLLDRVPWPDHHPALDAVVPDLSGHLWVRERSGTSGDLAGADSEPEVRWWSVFDPEGRWLGRVRVPDGLDVREIGEDYLLGVVTDDLGVERVRMHDLDRSG